MNSHCETLAWDPNSETNISGYRVYYGESSASPVTVDVGKVTSKTFTNLVGGRSYFFYVTAYNTAGLESSPSQTLNYTVPPNSNQPPAVQITSPTSGSSYTAPATIPISATASDSDGTVTKVAFYNGTTLLGTDTTSPFGFTMTGVGAGNLALRAQATDNSGATSTSSVVNVTITSPPQNQPPTISTIPDKTIPEDSASALANFTVADSDTALTSLTFSAVSSNTTLIANSTLAFGGSGTNRTLSYRPQADQSGSAMITITVSDGQASASSSFNVTVTPVNDPPVISDVADQSIGMNGSTGPLSVAISDKETASASLTLSAQSSNPMLVPESGLQLGGSGANRTITVTPATNQVGQATITLSVNDGASTASDSFVVTVTALPAGGGTPNYSLVENFEGPGYETAGWFEVNDPNEAARSNMEGRYGLRTVSGSQAYRVLNGATNVNFYFMMKWRSATPVHTLVDFSDSSGQPAGFLWVSDNEIRVTHGSATAAASFLYLTGTRYHFWLEWTEGSGADGQIAVYISTTALKPAMPLVSLSSGTGQSVDRVYFGGAAPDSPALLFDRIRMADIPIPSLPSP